MKFGRPKILLLLIFCGLVFIGWRLIFAPPLLWQPQSVSVKVEQPPTEEAVEQPPPAETAVPKPEVITPLVPSGHKPEIAIVIDDMGLNISGSERAMRLPAFITLSFMPYAPQLRRETAQARTDGHELLLHMPMEPLGNYDPGPGALLVDLPPAEIRARFEAGLDSFTGFDGVNNHMGSKFTAWPDGMEIVIDELQKRHLFFLDSRTSPKSVGESIAREHGLPAIARDVFLDDDLTSDAIKKQLAETERVAQRKGFAVAIGHPHDVTLEALEEWIPEAEKDGFEFIPVKNLISARQEAKN